MLYLYQQNKRRLQAMKKEAMKSQLLNIMYILKDKTQEGKGMTQEELKELYEKVYYLCQQS